MELALYILAGAAVGFAVGLTGIGGGSLMTPLLLLFGFPPHIAVGTDLLYAAITKAGGVTMHQRQGTIHWRIVLLLGAGSIPASLVTVWILHRYFPDGSAYASILTVALGFMLILTSLVILLRTRLQQGADLPAAEYGWARRNAGKLTFLMGIALGAMVTLSSVGAGAIGTAILLMLYPRLPSIHVVGTDLAHAVPLTLVAGLGHVTLGNVDWMLLGSLLIGSLPAIVVGTWVGTRIPNRFLQPLLAMVLFGLGTKYAFF